MRTLVLGTILLAAVAMEIDPLAAQDIPHDEYLNYMPLDYRRIVRQTDASAAFQLYGNPDAAGFLDEAPRDGVDDARGRLFHELGVRFAPYLIKNTTAAPMDFKKFMDQSSSFLLHVDRWNIGVRPPDLDGQETIDWANLLQAPCEISGPGVQIGPPSRSSGNDDCRLMNLLQEFDPFNPTDPRFTAQVSGLHQGLCSPVSEGDTKQPGRDSGIRIRTAVLAVLPFQRRRQQPRRRLGTPQRCHFTHVGR